MVKTVYQRLIAKNANKNHYALRIKCQNWHQVTQNHAEFNPNAPKTQVWPLAMNAIKEHPLFKLDINIDTTTNITIKETERRKNNLKVMKKTIPKRKLNYQYAMAPMVRLRLIAKFLKQNQCALTMLNPTLKLKMKWSTAESCQNAQINQVLKPV